MPICNQSRLGRNLRLLLNSNLLIKRTELSLFSFLNIRKNLSPSRKNLRVKSLGSISGLVKKKNPVRLFQKLKDQNQHLKKKHSKRMKWPSKILQLLRKRISFQSLLCCVSVHFSRMNSWSLKEGKQAIQQPEILFKCKER